MLAACGGDDDPDEPEAADGGDDTTEEGADAEEDMGDLVTLTLAHPFPAEHPIHVNIMEPFVEEVAEATDGTVTIGYGSVSALDGLVGLTEGGGAANPALPKLVPTLIAVRLTLLVWFVIPEPAKVSPNAWHLFALFIGHDRGDHPDDCCRAGPGAGGTMGAGGNLPL